MSLSSEYNRQFGWRPRSRIFDALPPPEGRTVLDLGCGVGDQAAELVARGARVIGVDMNEELLREAESRQLSNAEFRRADLRTPTDLGVAVDGLWCSFVAAYFPDLSAALASWGRHIEPGGWVALTEIDDLFGHEPLGARTKSFREAYARDALAANRYDLHMGRKLRDHLEQSGFRVSKVLTLEDQELSFGGPARPDVVDAWRTRLDRMKLLSDFCGPHFEQVREEFLGCLTRADHHCSRHFPLGRGGAQQSREPPNDRIEVTVGGWQVLGRRVGRISRVTHRRPDPGSKSARTTSQGMGNARASPYPKLSAASDGRRNARGVVKFR